MTDTKNTVSDERLAHYIEYADLVGDNGTPAISTGELASMARELQSLRASLPGGVGVKGGPLAGKYGEVLAPFVGMMEHELHANSGKGDRPGWLEMDRKTALLEIFYHLAKLQKATKDDDQDGIREYGADVANMAMMLVDICGALPSVEPVLSALDLSLAEGEIGR